MEKSYNKGDSRCLHIHDNWYDFFSILYFVLFHLLLHLVLLLLFLSKCSRRQDGRVPKWVDPSIFYPSISHTLQVEQLQVYSPSLSSLYTFYLCFGFVFMLTIFFLSSSHVIFCLFTNHQNRTATLSRNQ